MPIEFDGPNSKVSADTIAGQGGSTITIQSGHNLSGGGSGLTGLNATQLTSGTLPMARLSGTLPALNGSALTNLPAHSGNVAFPASQSASSNANTLDDYEEGTWTPSWNITSGSWSGTFSGADYIKIGKQVTASVKWQASAQATGTKINGVNGLPFTHANTGGGTAITYAIRKVGASNYILRMNVGPNLSTMNTGMSGEDTTTSSEFYPAHTGSGSEMYMTVTYIATA